MVITPYLKKRFCKEFNVPVAIYDEPYFMERLEIVSRIKRDALIHWQAFVSDLNTMFKDEQEYLEYYNKVKEDAITALKNNSYFVRFNTTDLPVINEKFPKQELYSPVNNGYFFISVDMRQANFNALKEYAPEMFDCKETWGDWFVEFSGVNHLLASKYIRQVIMGACNPGRQVQYEKYLMVQLYKELCYKANLENRVKLFSLTNDEIVLQVVDDFGYPSSDYLRVKEVFESVAPVIEEHNYMYRIECFRLEDIGEKKGYIRRYFNNNFTGFSDNIELKCVSSEDYHLVVKDIFGIPKTDNDLVFVYNNRLARYFNW